MRDQLKRALPIVCSMLLAGAASQALWAKECTAKSGERRVGLIELYTSEGCNSCPPADTWINELSRHGLSTDRVVPLALHVDYWDYIGWKDRFAKPQFTERQQLISRRNALGTIYTPQLALNGVVMRRWGDNDKLTAALNIVQEGKPGADLALSLQDNAADRLGITASALVHDAKDRASSALFLALYENKLSSEVRAGENRGVTLRHNYVVREWIGPLALDAAASAGVAREISVASDWKRQNLGVAAFVENRETGAVLQALALPVCSQQ